MAKSARAWRLSMVLRELQYPARKWMIQTVAELYGADVKSRIELGELPDLVYHDIVEVIAAVESRVNRPQDAPQHAAPAEARCCRRRA